MAYHQTDAYVQQPPGQVRSTLVHPEQPNTTYVQQGQHVEANNSNQNRPNLAKTSQRSVGIVQIVLGVVVMILGGATYADESRYSIDDFRYGLWCGPCMIVAGILGVVSASNQKSCSIIACMVMSIIASCFAFVFISLSAINCLFFRHARLLDPSGFLAVHGIGIIVGVAEIVMAIIQSAICCHASCCTGRQTQVASVVYVAQPFPALCTLQTQGYVQPSAGAHVNAPQPGGKPMVYQGMPLQATGPDQPTEAAIQVQGPVQPAQYGHQVDLPPAYAEKQPGA